MLSTPVRYCAKVTASPALKMSWKKRKSTRKNPTMRATASAFFRFPLSCGDLGLRLSSRETHLYAANADRRHPRALFFTSSQREDAAVRSGPGGSDAIGSGASAAATRSARPDASGDIAERSPTRASLPLRVHRVPARPSLIPRARRTARAPWSEGGMDCTQFAAGPRPEKDSEDGAAGHRRVRVRGRP